MGDAADDAFESALMCDEDYGWFDDYEENDNTISFSDYETDLTDDLTDAMAQLAPLLPMENIEWPTN